MQQQALLGSEQAQFCCTFLPFLEQPFNRHFAAVRIHPLSCLEARTTNNQNCSGAERNGCRANTSAQRSMQGAILRCSKARIQFNKKCSSGLNCGGRYRSDTPTSYPEPCDVITQVSRSLLCYFLGSV